ncbi:PH domain-containing protein [Nocardia arizonensis]|uniref:PH domain-containing protein n=1 Tax=Nocardia arizonensis TaxID=1141647 RepID=UPI0009E67E0F|nr:PH domain-containing protein [Nocardia arizonensis]
MLLVHPVTEVVKFIPVFVGTLILGTSSGNHGWSLVPLALVVGFALTRWFTTTYRIGPTHVELRTGLLRRRMLSVPRSRIRSVDIESDLLHRALGLSVVVLGTGQQADTGEKFELDSLDRRLVPALRATLLTHLTDVVKSEVEQSIPSAPRHAAGPGEREIGHWRASWVRYAPLSLTGFAVVAPIAGAAFQYGLGEVFFRSTAVHALEDGTAALVAAAAIGLFAAIFVLVSAAACTRYLATYFGLRVLDSGRTLQLRHGLFTTRQITLDLARFRGATVNEPLLLRMAGGAELEAIMVGENSRQKLLPQAPRSAVERTLAELLASRAALPGADSAPDTAEVTSAQSNTGAVVSTQGTVALIPHGPAARRRRHTRALALPGGAAAALLLLAVLGFAFSPWWWLLPALTAVAALALAEDRYRGLGHAVLPATAATRAWLITRSGSLDRDRDCLEGPGIIGWTVRQSFWQRRSGVATVVAATAAGKKRYLVVDVPLEQAYALIEAVTPGRIGIDGDQPTRGAR